MSTIALKRGRHSLRFPKMKVISSTVSVPEIILCLLLRFVLFGALAVVI